MGDTVSKTASVLSQPLEREVLQIHQVNLRCPDSKRSIQHACAKHESITRPAGLVLPLLPHKAARCIAFPCPARHDCTNEYSDEYSRQNKKQADVCQRRQGAVGKHDDEASKPGDDEIDDEDMPALKDIAFMEEPIHGDDLVGDDRRYGCGAEDPA